MEVTLKTLSKIQINNYNKFVLLIWMIDKPGVAGPCNAAERKPKKILPPAYKKVRKHELIVTKKTLSKIQINYYNKFVLLIWIILT